MRREHTVTVVEAEAAEGDPLEGLEIEVAPRELPARIDGVVVGTVVDLDPDGRPRVDHPFSGGHAPAVASSAVPITRDDIGSAVALLFEQGNARRPMIVGRMYDPPEAAEAPPAPAPAAGELPERLVFEAGREVVLRCGPASITLTRVGRVVIRGAHVQSRATGLNRIQGAAVKIN